jgi:hypothetical protein
VNRRNRRRRTASRGPERRPCCAALRASNSDGHRCSPDQIARILLALQS